MSEIKQSDIKEGDLILVRPAGGYAYTVEATDVMVRIWKTYKYDGATFEKVKPNGKR